MIGKCWETGLHYNWHRSYDPTVGRYTQADPLGFPDGPSRYAYAVNSPQVYIDKDGRIIPLVVAVVGSAAINAGAQFTFNFIANGGDWSMAAKCIDLADVAISGAFGAMGAGAGNLLFKRQFRKAATSSAAGGYLKLAYPPVPIRIGTQCECKASDARPDWAKFFH